MIFEKTLARGRALAALVSLVGAIDGLGLSIKARNEMVAERRSATAQWSDQEKLDFFLGLRTAAGIVDERFPTNIAAITAQTDDCIFFAKILASDLARYSNELKRREGWSYRLRVRKIAQTDWSYAEKIGLLPKDTDYEKWLRGFPPPPTIWQRFLALFRSKQSAGIDPVNLGSYTVVSKPAKEFDDGDGRRKFKRSMSMELVVDALELSNHIDHIVLFSGDGDFRSLVEAVQRRGVHVTVVSTLSSQPPMIADELRRQADVFTDLVELKPKIGRDPSERPASRSRSDNLRQ
jgi:hypothetical protein